MHSLPKLNFIFLGKEGISVVAVKTLKENATEKEQQDLLSELQVMKMLDTHPNVVKLLGCCSEKDPIFVIMEFVSKGKLQSYLRNSRAERYYNNMHGQSKTLTSRDLTSFVYQVARGMEFLSANGVSFKNDAHTRRFVKKMLCLYKLTKFLCLHFNSTQRFYFSQLLMPFMNIKSKVIKKCEYLYKQNW